MSNINRPVIAIVGSVRFDTLNSVCDKKREESISKFRKEAYKLGVALANAKMRLLVWSSDDDYIEIDVVKGYLSTENIDPDSIICVYHKDYPPCFPNQDDTGPILRKLSSYDDWEVGFYESIKELADGIILLGGGSTTLVAGVVAASWGKAIFSTPHFHGKAEMLYKWMHSVSLVVQDSVFTKSDLQLMSQPWSSENCIESILKQIEMKNNQNKSINMKEKELQKAAKQLRFNEKSNRIAIAVSLSIIVFILSMIASISIKSGIWDLTSFFIVLLSAGGLGSSLNLLGSQSKSSLPAFSSVILGAGIGFVVAIVQLASNISNFLSDQDLISVGIELVFSSAVVALLGGFGSEAALQTLKGKSKGN